MEPDPPDAAMIRSQVTALAEHFQRSGIHTLPQPNEQSVAKIKNWLETTHSPLVEGITATDDHQHHAQKSQLDTARSSNASNQKDSRTDSSKLNPLPVPPPSSRQAPTPSRLRTVDAVQTDTGPYPGPDLPDEQRKIQLDGLAASVAGCTKCSVLSGCRNTTVFGEGHVRPRVVFFGEAPGAEEDRLGRPFMGKAGQLLTKMIEACKFSREDVYILNTVKCRPPNNRNPELDERQNCRSFYQSQFSILRPDYIVCLGAVSAHELLQTKLSVGRLRGKLHKFHQSKVLVTYHPAYLLREPNVKKAAWQDLQIMLRDAKIQI